MLKAKHILTRPAGHNGTTQKLWKVGDTYVITSASTVFGDPETYVFLANEDGVITDWGELEGSFKGALDHQQAIDGYVQHANLVSRDDSLTAR